MAKITISDITAQFASETSLNLKFQQIEDEFNNKVVYRDETGAMAVDFDMGNNKTINVGNPTQSKDGANKKYVDDSVLGVIAGNYRFPNVSVDVLSTDAELDFNSGATVGTTLTTGDEGSGNGLDADTVDGKEAAEFMLLAGNSTKTGNITLEETNPSLTLNTTSVGNPIMWLKDNGTTRVQSYWDRGTDTYVISKIGTSGFSVKSQIELTNSGQVNLPLGNLALTGVMVTANAPELNDIDRSFNLATVINLTPFGTTTAGTPTGSFKAMTYRVGNLVFLQYLLAFTGLGGMAGDLRFNGLLHTVRNDTGSVIGALASISQSAALATGTDIIANPLNAQQTVSFNKSTSTTAITPLAITDLTSTTVIQGLVMYGSA